ncbi:MAG TPA: helix-turn-helix transcriptional regulator [Clostridiales bacterium]|nr:helix-turn-helix transcriptional regulator [Clostridiales bacterium]
MMPSLNKLAVFIVQLWNTQETLRIQNIRSSHLHHFLAFPLAMLIANIQDCLFASDIIIYGLPAVTVTFMSFAAGAAVAFAFASEKKLSVISRISAVIAAVGLIPWLFLPGGYPAFVCGLIIMAGIGGCLSSSGFSFVFVQNNTERFFGSVLMSFAISTVKYSKEFFLNNLLAGRILAAVLITGIAICMYKSKYMDFACAVKNKNRKLDPSIWLALFIFFSYFIFRIIHFYIPEFAPSPDRLWGMLTLVPALLCILMQLFFKRSIWMMCNVFFILVIISYILYFADSAAAAYLFSSAKVIGLMISFYILGCVENKFCDFLMHKLLFVICMVSIGVIYLVPDFLIKTTLTYPIALMVTSALFTIFLLLSPMFSQYLFCAGWSGEFKKLHMTEIASRVEETDRLKDYHLTPREKEICVLLLSGYSRKQIGAKLKISYPTVGFHCTSLYKKLGINSLSELFAMFGNKDNIAVRE